MNYWVSVVFRAIPLAMMVVCLGYGVDIWSTTADASSSVAGPVVTFLAAICLCLFATAATIIRQLIGRFTRTDAVLYPTLGYTLAAGTVAYGLALLWGSSSTRPHTDHYVAGHVVFGLGLISGCVATVATASTKFSLIPQNSVRPEGDRQPPSGAFRPGAFVAMATAPVVLALVAWVFAITNLVLPATSARFTAGHVLAGIAMVCTALIGLVLSILRQVQNSYEPRERLVWPWLVIALGSLALVWGVVLLILDRESYYRTPGLVVIGLGLVCFSILSKIGLLALVWRRTFALANRVPLVPIVTALSCLFLAAFVFEAAVADPSVYIAARVLVGLGAVCFTLYSIVSILESGTSSG
ncbi:DUF2776 family protein [Rhodococcus sp. CH91]|uniref:DUF2776 family protein n=1 Tax=Rhodococcus sp. CH91 TaxID=2910256 RepID=UPI001F4A8168|nr:DUF2776 family protein [Rhodococcus sp. CH91]